METSSDWRYSAKSKIRGKKRVEQISNNKNQIRESISFSEYLPAYFAYGRRKIK